MKRLSRKLWIFLGLKRRELKEPLLKFIKYASMAVLVLIAAPCIIGYYIISFIGWCCGGGFKWVYTFEELFVSWFMGLILYLVLILSSLFIKKIVCEKFIDWIAWNWELAERELQRREYNEGR